MNCKNVFQNISEGPCKITYTKLWIHLILQAAQEKTVQDMRKETEWKR